MITKSPKSVMDTALKSDREALKGNGEALNGNREVLKRTLRSNGNVLKGDKPGAKGR